MSDSTHTMSSALVAIHDRQIGSDLIQTVNARELHAFLDNGDAFAHWIADRIRQYDFTENVDFVTYWGNSQKGRPPKEYAISLDMAKELAMVERNEKGKQARRYFIDCERKAHAKPVATPFRRTPRIELSREARLTMSQNLRIARMIGLSGNQAVLSANQATAAMTGIDTLNLLGATRVNAPQQEALLSPTELGQRIGRSAREVNVMLCEIGYQTMGRDLKGHIYYEPTVEGLDAGGVMQDTGKKHSSGTPVRQLRWASSVAERIRERELLQ